MPYSPLMLMTGFVLTSVKVNVCSVTLLESPFIATAVYGMLLMSWHKKNKKW